MVSKKIILSILLVSFCTSMQAQKYFTKTGITNFKASVDAFEPVAATSNSTTAIVNTADGSIAALLFMKSFHFEVALMEEHFNENYMESTKFPKSTFSGTIENMAVVKTTVDGIYTSTVSGKLTIKDVTKDVSTVGKFTVKGGVVNTKATFTINPEDYNIDIPKTVSGKISREIKITVDADYRHAH